MTIFQHTIDKVLDGMKTRTSRLQKAGEELVRDDFMIADFIWTAKHRVLWITGADYAVQRGRGIAQEGRYRVLSLASQDVREITLGEVKAEGFDHPVEYFDVWCRMHDAVWYRDYLKTVPIHAHMPSPVVEHQFHRALWNRPLDHYLAWIINFEVCR